MSATTEPGRGDPGLAALAGAWRGELAGDAAVPAQVRAALLRDWRDLAGAALSERVLRHWPASLDRGALDQPPEAWIAAGAWLSLHHLLIVHGWGGDALAFAEAWHRLVAARVGRPARWALRAFGVPRALAHLPQVWGHGYRSPPPQPRLDGATLTLAFAADPLGDAPLARLLLACQVRLACELLSGRPQRLAVELAPAGWALQTRNDS